MLDECKTTGAAFYAPRYFVELWNGWNTRVDFGGFTAIIRPLADIDRAEDVRDHCEPTRALIKAVGNMRVVRGRWGWWTDHWAQNLDGWRGYDLDGAPPPPVVAAIASAYPLPKTITEAHDEYAYWGWRAYGNGMVMPDDESATALDALAAPELDLVCQVRTEIVRRLLVPGLVATSIAEVALKQRMYVFIKGRDHLLEASILRDLSHLDRVLARPASVHVQQPVIVRQVVKVPLVVMAPAEPAPAKAPKQTRTQGVQNPAVTEQLLQVPRPSDRAIARKLGISQTTVGTERKRLIKAGLIDPDARAFVERRNVRGTYEMKPREQRSRSQAADERSPTSSLTPPLPASTATTGALPVLCLPTAEQLSFPWKS